PAQGRICASAGRGRATAMSANFDRTLSNQDVLRRRASLLQRLHIDGLLMLLLLVLAAGSLFILYSASGKNWDMLIKQSTSFGIGLCGMLVIAQLEPRFMARWVPLAYLGVVGLLLVVACMCHTEIVVTCMFIDVGLLISQPDGVSVPCSIL